MMREQDHLLVSGLGALDQPGQPWRLVRSRVVGAIASVQPDEQEVIVLDGEAARRLVECRQRAIEVALAAGVHLVVGVERATQRARDRRPHRQEAVLDLLGGARVVDIAEVEHHVVGGARLLDRGRADRRAVAPRAPVAEHGDARMRRDAVRRLGRPGVGPLAQAPPPGDQARRPADDIVLVELRLVVAVGQQIELAAVPEVLEAARRRLGEERLEQRGRTGTGREHDAGAIELGLEQRERLLEAGGDLLAQRLVVGRVGAARIDSFWHRFWHRRVERRRPGLQQPAEGAERAARRDQHIVILVGHAATPSVVSRLRLASSSANAEVASPMLRRLPAASRRAPAWMPSANPRSRSMIKPPAVPGAPYPSYANVKPPLGGSSTLPIITWRTPSAGAKCCANAMSPRWNCGKPIIATRCPATGRSPWMRSSANGRARSTASSRTCGHSRSGPPGGSGAIGPRYADTACAGPPGPSRRSAAAPAGMRPAAAGAAGDSIGQYGQRSCRGWS